VRKIVLIGAMVLLVGSAHAQATKSPETAPATPPVSESQSAPAPEVSAPATPAPAAAQGPATQAQPAVAAPPTPKPSKKRQARRYESDEQKARRIAAKYGISW
jgi:hypothetical protein